MAHNDVEVELKFPVDATTFAALRQKLQQTASFISTKQETDDYLTPAHRDFLKPEFPYEWLRVRNKEGKFILNYKHFHPENVKQTTHCDEFETEVSKPEQLQKLLKSLDFRTLITVRKTRETFRTEGFEFALDTVDELGHFVEIEALKDFGGITVTRDKLFAAAREIGITTESDLRGYPFILMQKKGLRL